MTEVDKKKTDERMTGLITAYKCLSKGAQAELRRLESHDDAMHLAGEAFYTCKNAIKQGEKDAYHDEVLSALLILFRDRGANSESLKIGDRSLGRQFAGTENEQPVKLGRFKRLMAADTLEKGFESLRPLLRLFRHEDVNWSQAASLLSALYRHGKDPIRSKKQLNYAKKRLAEAYFGAAATTENRSAL